MKRNLSLLLGVLAAAAGCQKTESTTELVLEISTNIPVPAGMDTLSLKVGPQANPQAFSKTYPLGPGKIMLPRRMTLVPTDTSTVLSVLVEGLLNTKTVVSRSVITRFVQGESRLLRVELLQKCLGQICPNNQTCTPSASCADPNVDPTNLPIFDPSKGPSLPGLDPDAGVSMDAPIVDVRSDLSGKDGSSFDSLPGVERDGSDGRPGSDGTPSTSPDGWSVDSVSIDVPGGSVIPPVPDGSVAGDGPKAIDGPTVVKPDTGSAVDTPITSPDGPSASKTPGVACTLSGECSTGLCIDGVCCESKCDGRCMACNVPGKLGTCSLVPLNEPSNGDCPDDGVSTCGRNGRCDGLGGCMVYPSGVACTAETCPAGTSTHTLSGVCDGRGSCRPGQLQDCTPFRCNATTQACSLTCVSDSDCVAPNNCSQGSCGRKGDGLPCSAPGECRSNICAQGVCCAGECTGLCKSCAVEGWLGTCTAVLAGKPDVQGRCADQGVATCGTNGLCDGTGACQRYGDNLVCGSQCNAAAASFSTSTCSAGACTPGTPQPCSPYSCDGNGCKKSCTVLADCAPGFVCGAGGLCVRPPEDCMNEKDDDGDGQVDCADLDCQPGFMCVPTAPAGFTGPVELFEGAQADLPKCDGAYPSEAFTGWGPPQCSVTCSECGCGSPQNVTCGNPSISLGYVSGITVPRCPNEPIAFASGCHEVPGNVNTYATYAGLASGGSCPSTGGSPILSPVGWNAGRVCGSQAKGGAGCAAGLICWPKPQAPYLPQACVLGSGDQACPTSGYAKKRDYYDTQEIKDTRDCMSSCDCGMPKDVSCDAMVTVYSPDKDGLMCDSRYFLDEQKTPSVCTKVSSNIGSIKVTLSAKIFSGGSCKPVGDAFPSGTCEPLGKQTTVCCMP